MTVEHESSLASMETPTADGTEPSPAGEKRVHRSVLAVLIRCSRWCLARWRPILAAMLVATSVGVASGLFFLQYLPDRQIDDAAAHRAIQAASDGAVAVLSYSPENLDRDLATARSHLTGEFLDYYTKFSDQFITPMAREKHITATAKVVQAAVSELHPDSATVLMFVNQNTTTAEKPEPLLTASSILVTMKKIEGSWLIAKVDPLG
ncbi:hypothetical protein [Mycobacterium shimoidei]|uniref:Heat shock protein DnaJ domain-containing protein [Nocardioides sp. JS614] n=1 Tax=Mycobacterium shimoidei TaxID=29313 RepID=A0A1E3SUZ1_MYCSH|nr:hypothetical protein [Mycobacterium shimoidei]MCV7260180.1 hypothetical protein [Mycobacterium shimoidei]ODR05433.1 hypothetical protein BHQ16_22145 [Mycobacterium shimoidei]ORW81867.1 hypothetical protein AWC26_06710 [Mycobacterium shimoidei]SRX93725.1 heat shock protein DnaJ domain-containing protein [Nocardioides sp. JS614] [Mycobacterium shimoidei]